VTEGARHRRISRADTGASRGHAASSTDNRDLIRREQEIQRLRGLLREGAASAPTAPTDRAYFSALRDRLKQPQRA
jgi:antitoxin ParD1/3/4